MTIKKPVLKKPDGTKPSRFDGAKKFATEVVTDTEQTEAQEEKVTTLKNPQDALTRRENFDLDIDLGKEMRHFLSDSRRFRTKRDFLTQCLIDGLEKYKGQ